MKNVMRINGLFAHTDTVVAVVALVVAILSLVLSWYVIAAEAAAEAAVAAAQPLFAISHIIRCAVKSIS